MIYSYIAAIIGMALLIGISSIAILSISKTVTRNIRSKTLNLISTYDEILDEYSSELDKMKVEIKNIKKTTSATQQVVTFQPNTRMRPTRNFSPSVLSTVEKVANAKYVGESSFEIYKTLKDGFRINIDDVVSKIPNFDAPIGKATGLLQELDSQTVLSLITLPTNLQYELLKDSMTEEHLQFLNEFCEDEEEVDTIEFCNYLQTKAAKETQKPVIYISPGFDVSSLPSDVEIKVDENLCEGFKIFVNNQIYDYSVRNKVVG